MPKCLPLTALIAITCLVGCRADAEVGADAPPAPGRIEGTDEPSESKSLKAEANALDRYIAEIQKAQTPQAEADGLRRLMRHGADNRLIYTTRAFRTYDKVLIKDPSVQSEPVQVEVTIFRGKAPVRTFAFVAKDNRNLALLGE